MLSYFTLRAKDSNKNDCFLCKQSHLTYGAPLHFTGIQTRPDMGLVDLPDKQIQDEVGVSFGSLKSVK